MRHDSLGLDLDDAMKGGSSTQGRYQKHTSSLAVAYLGYRCRGRHWLSTRTGLCFLQAWLGSGGTGRTGRKGIVARGGLRRRVPQATGCLLCSSFPPRLSTTSSTPRSTPVARDSERDYCCDKSRLGHTAQLLSARTGCGLGDVWSEALCSLPRRSGQGFPGICDDSD